MALSDVVARRYGAAYFALARESGDVPAWRAGLAQAVSALGSHEVLGLLANPRVAHEDRVRIAMSLAGDVPAETRNLVRLLVDRGRLAVLPKVLEEFDRLADRAAGTVRAEVVAAVPVDPRLREEIGTALSRRLGGPVQTTVRHDPAILGGLVIRIGDRVIDGSVATRLEQLKAALA